MLRKSTHITFTLTKSPKSAIGRTQSISTHKYPEWHFYGDSRPYKSHGKAKGSSHTVHLKKRRHGSLSNTTNTVRSDSDIQKPDVWVPVSGLGGEMKHRKKYTRGFLDSFHMIGDPLADSAVHDLVKNNQQQWYRNFMRTPMKNSQMLPSEYPSVLHEFVSRSSRLPYWVEKAKLRLASDLFWRYAYAISASLNWASLPLTYSVPEGAIVLERTGEMESKTKSRILRTSKLITSVNSSHGFEPQGYAAINVAKVRLTHAFVRYDLCSGEAAHDWCFEKDGIAINQRDQVGTLMVFSILIVDCLERLGAHITMEEKEAVLHLWQVVGYMQGIDLRLIPQSVDEAFGLARAIAREYSRSSDIGHELTKSLIVFLKEVTPGKMGDGIHETMMRYLLGDQLADQVGISPYSAHSPLVIKAVQTAMHKIEKISDESKLAGKGMEFLRWANLNTATFVMSQGKRMDFNLSNNMLKDFGMMQ